MEVIGYFAVCVFGAWVSFILAFWATIARVRGGLEAFIPALGMGVLAGVIWMVGFVWWAHL